MSLILLLSGHDSRVRIQIFANIYIARKINMDISFKFDVESDRGRGCMQQEQNCISSVK